MLRDRELEEIYDGHFYLPDDLVPVGVGDCAGCSACCRNTGDTIILDPYDMFQLCRGTEKTFTDMIEHEIEIRLVDGLILPNLMQHHEPASGGSADGPQAGRRLSRGRTEHPGETADASALQGDHCPFLSGAGRCTIHPWRPGFCRLYPMGRYYTEDGFRYILQKEECTDREKTPVRLRDWLGIEDLARYEDYILDWHSFRKSAEAGMEKLTERSLDSVRRYILQIFYVHPYITEQDFYPQYQARMDVCREALEQIL